MPEITNTDKPTFEPESSPNICIQCGDGLLDFGGIRGCFNRKCTKRSRTRLDQIEEAIIALAERIDRSEQVGRYSIEAAKKEVLKLLGKIE